MRSDELKAFLNGIREAKTTLNIAIEEENEADKQTQDILHAIEMEEYNPRRTSALVKTLQGVRKRRRIAKETIERLTPVVGWADDNRNAIKTLERLLGDLRKIESHQENRLYAQRTDILESGNLLIGKGGNDHE